MKKMGNFCKELILIFFVLYSPIFVYSRTITVGHGPEYDYQTITQAMSAASPMDLILVAPGTYSTDTGESFPITFKAAVIVQPDSQTGTRLLLGDGSGTGVLFNNVSSLAQTTLRGFVIRNFAWGIRIIDSAYVGIEQCIVEQNTLHGIEVIDSDTVGIDNCLIQSNITSSNRIDGVGMFFQNAGVTITYSIIRDNYNLGENSCGGGLFAEYSTINMSNVTFLSNACQSGTAAFLRNCEAGFSNCDFKYNLGKGAVVTNHFSDCSLYNCVFFCNNGHSCFYNQTVGTDTVRLNKITFTGNINSDGVIYCAGGDITIKNSIIHGNVGETINNYGSGSVDVTYSDICNYPGTGNICADPQFVGWDTRTAIFIDAVTGHCDGCGSLNSPCISLECALENYSLQLANTSPCIGSGENGENMGANTGIGGAPGNTRVNFRFASGEYKNIGGWTALARNISCDTGGYAFLDGDLYIAHPDTSVANIRTLDLIFQCDSTGNFTNCQFSGIDCGKGAHPTFERCVIEGGLTTIYEGAYPSFRNCEFKNNVTLGGNEDSAPEFERCTFQDNVTGRICMFYNSSPTMNNCIFKNNQAMNILYLGENTRGTFQDCQFVNNQSQSFFSLLGPASILFLEKSNNSFQNCVFSGSNVSGGIAVVYASENSDTFTNCTFSGNLGTTYQGIGSQTSFHNCVFSENMSLDAGTLNFGGQSNEMLYNCLIYANFAYTGGGGIVSEDSTPKFYNCTIANNDSWISGDGLLAQGGALPALSNCIVWTNEGDGLEVLDETSSFIVTYSCIRGGWAGVGNFDLDPQFEDAPNGVYLLDDTSPCIDAGDPNPMYNDACRLPGRGTERNDMGCYGGPENCNWGIVGEEDFTGGSNGWTFFGNFPSFDTALYNASGWCLGLSPGGSASCFSYWGSPSAEIPGDKYYHMIWRVGSTAENPNRTVSFRLRVNSENTLHYWTTGVNSFCNSAPGMDADKTYNLFFCPRSQGNDRITVSFDILSFDPTDDLNSWIYLDEVTLQECKIAPIGNPSIAYSFSTGNEGWQFAGSIGTYDTPLYTDSDGHLGLSPNGSANCFSYWMSPIETIDPKHSYCTIWEVASSATNPVQTVDFRLRVNQEEVWRYWEFGTSTNGQDNPYAGNPLKYELIFVPEETINPERVCFSFDIMSFDPNNNLNSWIYLESFEMEPIKFTN